MTMWNYLIIPNHSVGLQYLSLALVLKERKRYLHGVKTSSKEEDDCRVVYSLEHKAFLYMPVTKRFHKNYTCEESLRWFLF